jgi:hypothetical protein
MNFFGVYCVVVMTLKSWNYWVGLGALAILVLGIWLGRKLEMAADRRIETELRSR